MSDCLFFFNCVQYKQLFSKVYRYHEFSLQRYELAITSVSALVSNQFVASELQRARDHGQSAVVTPRVKVGFSFLSCFSRYLIVFIPIDS